MQPSDFWALAAAALLATCSVPVSRAVVARYRLPAAPVVARIAPAPPQDLLGYSQATTVPDVEAEADAADDSRKVAMKSHDRRPGPAMVRNAANHGVVPAATIANGSSSAVAPVLTGLPVPTPIAHVDHATLKIEIDSTVGDGALGIFADQVLLFTADLHATTAGAPVRLEHALPVGPHQLRVALYRPDKSMQVAKEGLGEIRTDGANTLHIHVTKKAKMLVRRETTLDVLWPSALTPAGSASAKLSASTK